MHLATVAVLFGGSLLVSAPLAASDSSQPQPGSSSVSRASIPQEVTSQNIRDAAPATTRFTAQNGYTGDLTLLAPTRGLAKPTAGIRMTPAEVGAATKMPEELPRFDRQLPQPRPAVPLLETFRVPMLETFQRTSAPPVIYHVPGAGEK
jgi:hypothetical protein